MNTDNGLFRRTRRFCLLFVLGCGIGSAQVYITTGQTGANGKLPGQWTMTPGTGTPFSFTFGGAYFLMGVSTGYTYQLNVHAGSSSGTLLGSVTKTAAELCPSNCSGFNNHIFTLPAPLTFSAPNSYYVEIIGLDAMNVPESGPSAPDGLKNPTTFSWVTSLGTGIDLSTITAPGPPTSVTGSAGNGQIVVNSTAPAVTGGSAILSYLATAVPHAGGTPVTSSCLGQVTSCAIPNLVNGTPYDVSVQAVNIIGPGTSASASNNPITPSAAAPATSFTLTGPPGGAINVASDNFTVTPDAAFTGTITIIPSGGGLSTPIDLTFDDSPTAQTFTVTPVVVGPVTLTPGNDGTLANASPLTYSTPPAAPEAGTATPENGQIAIDFTAPDSDGGSPITTYTATCDPGSISGSGTLSPIVVTGLINGTGYTCSLTATNAFGTSTASTASGSTTPFLPATSFSFTGPGGGSLNAASGLFTVTPNAVYTGTITITPSGGGLSTPIVLTFASSAAAQTFTVTPTVAGPVTLTPSNSGALTSPGTISYATSSSAPIIGVATPGDGTISLTFSAPAGNGGSPITGYTATCNPGGFTASGAGSPMVVSGLTNGTAYTCSVTATNAFGTSASSSASAPVTPVASATTFTLTGPAGGPINGPSGTFTVIPNAPYAGTITVTPSSGGLSTPIVLTFSTLTGSQTFTVTPGAVGPITLTPSNNGSLSNPPALTYGTPSSVPVIGTAAAGNASISVAFTAPANDGGSSITGYTATCNPGGVSVTGSASPIIVDGLTNGTAYTCTVTATNAFGTSSASTASNSVTPGTGLSIVNAASYQALGITPGYLGTLFGDKLATGTEVATTTPLPITLGGTSVVLIDASGQRVSLQLYFVSTGQINFVVPEAAKVGPGVLQVTVDGTTTSTPINVSAVQPGLFSASQNGIGPAIGNVLHRNVDGTEFYTALSACTGQTLDTCTTVPIQFTTPGQHIYLSFFGTGFRGRSSQDAVVVLVNGVQAQVLYSSLQPIYAGLDQLNVELPSALAGVGSVVVKTWIDGQPANDVAVTIP